MLYFLLVAGEIFLRRIVEVLPNFGDKRQAVDISQQIEADISAYLLTITAMNAAVGVATGIAMYLRGLGDPLLWGAAAFLFLTTSNSWATVWNSHLPPGRNVELRYLWWALFPPALYFGIHLVEGETLTPMLLARRFTLNPVLVILSLVFWFWMWGVPGAHLGRSNAGHPEDRQRSGAPAKSFRARPRRIIAVSPLGGGKTGFAG